MGKVKKMERLRLQGSKGFFVFLILGALLCSCAGNQYLTPRQKEGDRLLLAKKPDQAIAAYKKEVQEAERGGDKRELAHLKSLLGWAYAEAMRLEEGEKEIQEAVQIAEANGFDAALFYARLAAVESKSMNYQEGFGAAEKALTLIAQKWQPRAKTQDRSQVIDYAISHHGLPPDVDMIKTVTMAESSLTVLHVLKGDYEMAGEWGERSVRHYQSLTSLMKMAQEGDKVEFFRGMGVAAAGASQAYRNLGDRSKEDKFKQVGIEAFRKVGVEVKGEDLLSAYAESGGYLSLAKTTTGVFRPDARFSPEFNRAEKLYFDGRYQEALPAYREAIARARQRATLGEAARGLSQMGWLLAELGRYPEAMRVMREAVSLQPRGDWTSVTYARLATIEGRLGNYEKGLQDADQALEAIFKSREKMFAGKDREAVIDGSMKNPGIPPDTILIKGVTSAEGARTTVYYLKGEFKEAIRGGEKTIRHFQDILPAVRLAPEREQVVYFEGMGFVTLCVGDSYCRTGESQKGRDYLERSRDFFKKARLNYGDVVAEGLIAYSHVGEGNYPRAAELFKKNWPRIEAGGLEELKWRIRSALAQSLHAEAKELGPRVKELQSKRDPGELFRLKQEMLEKNREKAAVLNTLLGKEAEERFSSILDALRKAEDRDSALHNLESLIRFLKEEAFKNYLGAVENVESIRSLLETDLNKRLFQANKQAIYEGFIQLSTELYGPVKGFEALERAKARSFMDLLATKEVAFRGGEIVKEERAIREAVGAAQRRARDEETRGEGPLAPRTRGEWDADIAKYRDLQLKIKREEPELASLVTASYLTYEDLRKNWPPETTLLAYFVADDKTYIWALDQKTAQVKEVPIAKGELKKWVGDFREAIAERNGEKERTLGRRLYDALILPAKGQIRGKRIGIIPHQGLHYLPFGALHSGEGYFIEEFPLFHSPSASVLKYALDKAQKRGERLLALGNPDLGNPAFDLPFAQKEVEDIARFYPASRTYYGKQASKGAFLQECAGYDLIHLACHAEFSEIDPLYSSIRLARESNGDGRLETQEIFSLQIRPSLVVLSACKTGLGVITSGDEVMGMNRAFIYAGTPSILSSLWSVSDLSTARLMEGFYQNLKTLPKDEALQKAQLELIRNRDFSSPFFWAAFYLTGDWK